MRLPRVFGASADHRPAWTTALVLALAGGAHALSLAWPFARGLEPGQPVAWLQLAAMTTLVWQLQRCQGARQGGEEGGEGRRVTSNNGIIIPQNTKNKTQKNK